MQEGQWTKGQLIKRARKEAGLTQTDLAKLTDGIYPSDISNWEKGNRTLSDRNYKKLLDAIAGKMIENGKQSSYVQKHEKSNTPNYKQVYQSAVEEAIKSNDQAVEKKEDIVEGVRQFIASVQSMMDELVRLRDVEAKFNEIKKENETILSIINRARKEVLIPDQEKPRFVFDKDSNSMERIS